MTLFRLNYLVYGFGNCVDDISTKTGLRSITPFSPCTRATARSIVFLVFGEDPDELVLGFRGFGLVVT